MLVAHMFKLHTSPAYRKIDLSLILPELCPWLLGEGIVDWSKRHFAVVVAYNAV